ncbi:MAG: hypothetical protein H0X29_06610 [Parachlamydiaceae bacterium]|nr:hypothetical protein [Parachlamydiaceae bacterium]
MRKNNHETLADQLKKMVGMHNQHYMDLEERLDFIQLLFTEAQYVQDRPLMKDKALKAMAIVYSLGASLLAPCKEIQTAFRTFKQAPGRFDSFFLYPPAPRLKLGWFTPWKVNVILPNKMRADVERFKQQSFLYCASEKEIDHHIRWFEQERATDSFVHQLRSIQAISLEGNTIKYNSGTHCKPIFKNAIKEWRDSIEHSDQVPETDESLYALKFAPQKNQTCWSAWEQVVKIIHEESCRHRDGLLIIYRKKLEEVFFKALDLDQKVKKNYLAGFRDHVKGTHLKPKKHKEGRWESSSAIDCWTASKLIMHIVLEFIQNPNKKALGETACALWTMVWCSQELPGEITKEQVLALSTINFNAEEATLNINDNIIEIADGLSQLLSILRGRSSGKRSHLLFKNLTPKEFERILHDASIAVLVPESPAILPSDFLTFPHIYANIRMASKQRLSMQQGRHMVKPRWTGAELKRDYQNLKTP